MARPRRMILAAGLLATACGGATPGSPTPPPAGPTPIPPATLEWRWRNLTPASGPLPEARAHGVAVFDPVGQRLVVFGGQARGRCERHMAFDSRWALVGSRPRGRPRPGGRCGRGYDTVGTGWCSGRAGGGGRQRKWTSTWILTAGGTCARHSPRRATDRPRVHQSGGVVQFAGFTNLQARFANGGVDVESGHWRDLTTDTAGPAQPADQRALHEPSSRIVYGGQGTASWTTVGLRPGRARVD